MLSMVQLMSMLLHSHNTIIICGCYYVVTMTDQFRDLYTLTCNTTYVATSNCNNKDKGKSLYIEGYIS